MSRRKSETSLHSAAKRIRVESIRELLYDKQCDPATPNVYGKTAAFMYFIGMLNKANNCGSDSYFTAEEIACFTELLWFTYDTKDTERSMETHQREVFDMLDYCYQFSDVPIRKLFLEIVNVFVTPSHHRRYFVDKILAANLSSDYCLIALTFDETNLLIDKDFANLTSNFLRELFALFIADECFFEEYLGEVMSSGWTFSVSDQSWALNTALAQHDDIASVFRFIKHLIRYQIDFVNLLQCCIRQLPPESADTIGIGVLVPLSNFKNAPVDLARILRRGKWTRLTSQSSYYNFNETENILDDFTAFVESKPNSFRVASLKNLARMSIRECVFRNHSHYKALSLLYSLGDIPATLRNFLCYNYCNLKF